MQFEILSAYIEGDLSVEETKKVELALQGSETLRAELEELREMTQTLKGMGTTELRRDLWPSVATALKREPWWKFWLRFDFGYVLKNGGGVLAGAAACLALMTVLQKGPDSEATVGLAAARETYQQAILELEEQGGEHLKQLSPKVREALGQSMVEVDRAILEAETALREAPHDMFAHRMTLALYDEKIRILKAAQTQSLD